MKVSLLFCLMRLLLIAICSFCAINTEAQSADTLEGDYFIGSIQRKSERTCCRLVNCTIRKLNWTSTKIEKANFKYLQKFEEEEEKLLQKLCLVNEQSAERMISDAILSHNRFTNMQERGERIPEQKRVASFEAMRTMMNESFLQSKPTERSLGSVTSREVNCHCDGLSELKKAFDRFDKAIDEHHRIERYLDERTNFLMQNLDKTEFVGLLNGLKINNAYLDNSTRDILSAGTMFNEKNTKALEALISGRGSASLNEEYNPSFDSKDHSLKLDDLVKEMDEEQLAKFQLFQSNPALFRLASTHAKFFLSDSLKWSTMLMSADSLRMSVERLSKQLVEDDSLSKVKGIRNQHSMDSIGRAPSIVSNELKINPLKTKRLQDRLIKSFSLQPVRGSNELPSSLNPQFNLSFQGTEKFNFGLGYDFIFKVESRREEKKDSYFYLPKTQYSGFTYRIYTEFKLNSKLWLKATAERQVYLNIGPGSNTPANLNIVLVGCKMSTRGSSISQPTVEILFNPIPSNTQPLFVVRTGFQLYSRNSHH